MSYYKTIDGVKMDGEILELAEVECQAVRETGGFHWRMLSSF